MHPSCLFFIKTKIRIFWGPKKKDALRICEIYIRMFNMTTWDLWSHIRPSCCGLYNYDRTLFEPLQILKKLLKTPLLKPNHVQTKIIWPDSVLKKNLLSFVGQIEILALSKARVLISRTAPKISARDVTRKKSAFLRLRTSRGYTWCTETRVSSWAFRMDPPGIAMAKLPRSAMAAFAASATWNFWGKWLCHFFSWGKVNKNAGVCVWIKRDQGGS